jgi:hypothetical protein
LGHCGVVYDFLFVALDKRYLTIFENLGIVFAEVLNFLDPFRAIKQQKISFISAERGLARWLHKCETDAHHSRDMVAIW